MSATGKSLLCLVFVVVSSIVLPAAGDQTTPTLVFRSSVDLVSVTAVVRDHKGRVVSALTRNDFEVLDAGQKRPIVEIHADQAAPASVAFLIDGSGSMRLGAAHTSSRRISEAVLDSLDSSRDDAALFSFDTRLLTLRQFTHDLAQVRRGLDDVEAWGSTSLYDAIAGTVGAVSGRARNRRAVIVLTDGTDTTSSYTPDEVSWIASTIDVPIYVFAVAPAAPGSKLTKGADAPMPVLAQLARATGGDYYVAATPELVARGIHKLVEELRHQYVIAFESGTDHAGLRSIEIRTRKPEFRVKSRKWYSGSQTTGE